MIENTEIDDKVIYKVSPLAKVKIETVYYSYQDKLYIYFSNGKRARIYPHAKEPVFFFSKKEKAVAFLRTFSENKLQEFHKRYEEAKIQFKEIATFLEDF